MKCFYVCFQSAYDPYDPYSTKNEMEGNESAANPPRSSLVGQNGFYDGASQSQGNRQNGRATSQDPGYRSSMPLHNNTASHPNMNGYESSPSSKYSTPPMGGGNGMMDQQQQRMRYSDYKPVPPPKSSVYKPVPPPKPKSSYQTPPSSSGLMANGNHKLSLPMMGTQQPGSLQNPPSMSQQNGYVPEGNYMNSGQVKASVNGGYASSMHYHSSQVSKLLSLNEAFKFAWALHRFSFS